MSTATCQIQQSGPAAAVVQPPSVQAQRHAARALVLLEAPIAATLVKLAAPNILVNIAQSSVGLIGPSSWASSAQTHSLVLRWCSR